VLAPGRDVDGLNAVIVGGVGVVMNGLGDGDVDAADGVDHVPDALQTDERIAIDALSEDVRADVIDRAEGNPLYIEEFLRTLIETGRIEQRDPRGQARIERGRGQRDRPA